jgi:hypothetical protein
VRGGEDHQRGVGVAEVVEAQAGEPASSDGWPEHAVGEIVVVQDPASGEAKTSPSSFGLRASSCRRSACRAVLERSTRRRDARVLTGTSSPRVGAVLDLDSHRIEVDALVDEVAALLRVREHLLEHAERELGQTRRAACERGDLVLDRNGADLVERERVEDVEVRHDLADARKRRGADAQRVAVDPAGNELAERLGRRLVDGAERPASATPDLELVSE